MTKAKNRPSHVAYHEAGHAVVALAFGARLEIVSIVPDEAQGWSGSVHHRGLVEKPHERTTVRFAGPAAQRLSHPRSPVRHHGKFDFEGAELTAAVLYESFRSRKTFLRRAADEARTLVERHWFSIEAVAQGLASHGALSGITATRIVQEAERNWAQLGAYNPDLSPFDYVRREARRRAEAIRKSVPPGCAAIAQATLRAVMAGRTDIEAAVIADLTGRGYAQSDCVAAWRRRAAREQGSSAA